MRVRISKQTIEYAKANFRADPSPVILWDQQLRGFGVRVGPPNTKYPNGKISYFVQKRSGGRGSKEFRYVFGEYPQLDISTARNKALSLIADVRDNLNIAKRRKDTVELRRAEAEASRTKKFKDIFEAYRKLRSDGSYYWETDILYYYNKYYVPHFSDLAVTEIAKGDIRTYSRASNTNQSQKKQKPSWPHFSSTASAKISSRPILWRTWLPSPSSNPATGCSPRKS
jgi:hypothetical protein